MQVGLCIRAFLVVCCFGVLAGCGSDIFDVNRADSSNKTEPDSGDDSSAVKVSTVEDQNELHTPLLNPALYQYRGFESGSGASIVNWNRTRRIFSGFFAGATGLASVLTNGSSTTGTYLEGTWEFDSTPKQIRYERLHLAPGTFGVANAGVCAVGSAPNCRPVWGGDPVAYDYKATDQAVFPYETTYKWRDVTKISATVTHTTATNQSTTFPADCGFALGFGSRGSNPLAPLAASNLRLGSRSNNNEYLRFHYRLQGREDSFYVEGPLSSNSGDPFGFFRVTNADPVVPFNMVQDAGPLAYGEYVKYEWEILVDHSAKTLTHKFTPIATSQTLSSMTPTQAVWNYDNAPNAMNSNSTEARGGLRFQSGAGFFTLDDWLDSQVSVGFFAVGVPLKCEFQNVKVTYNK